MATRTRTYAQLSPWAETIPWDCLVRETRCCAGPEHAHQPMVGDACAGPDCGRPLLIDETCYAVTELKREPGGRERWVCWRHVRVDEGPVTTARAGG